MAEYLAMRIIDKDNGIGGIDYGIAINKYPQYKNEIDVILINNNKQYLIL